LFKTSGSVNFSQRYSFFDIGYCVGFGFGQEFILIPFMNFSTGINEEKSVVFNGIIFWHTICYLFNSCENN